MKGNLTDDQSAIIRALIAAQVAVLEWGEEEIREPNSPAREALDKALKEAVKISKRLT